MAVNSKAIKRRIRSVNNTKKITKAMEMVSAAKMRRAVDAALRTRTYAVMARQILDLLGQAERERFPLLQIHPVKKMLVILIASNRTLCGSYNANVFRKTKAMLERSAQFATHHEQVEMPEGEVTQPLQIELVGVGRKSAEFAKKNNLPLAAVFDNFGDRPSFEDILPLARMVQEGYVNGTYQKILVAYTDYRSSLLQEPRMTQLMPIQLADIERLIAHLDVKIETLPKTPAEEQSIQLEEYLVEPNLDELVTNILPRLVEVQLYQTILESLASEHSARMMAMRNASEAASDMIRELNLTYNKARQASITQEISEIVGGAAALG